MDNYEPMDAEDKAQMERVLAGIEYRTCKCGKKILVKISSPTRVCDDCKVVKKKERKRVCIYNGVEYSWIEFYEKFKHLNPSLSRGAFLERMKNNNSPMEELRAKKKVKQGIKVTHQGKEWGKKDFFRKFKHLAPKGISYSTYSKRVISGMGAMESILSPRKK